MSIDRNAASWTTTQLLADVRAKARLPLNHTDYTDARLLREASEVVWSFAGWAQSLSKDGRLSFSFDRSVLDAIGSPYRAASEFFLPPHAIGDTIQNVLWVSQDGAMSAPLAPISIGGEHEYDSPDSAGVPSAFALLDGRIRVYPQPAEPGLIRYNYQRRHGELIPDNSTIAPVVMSASAGDGGYTMFAVNSSIGLTFAVGEYVDLVNDQYPYRVIYSDLYVGQVTPGQVSLFVPSAYIETLPVQGMRLVRSGQAPYVSLPLELRLCLTLKTCAHVLLGAGDDKLGGNYNALAENEMSRQLGVMNPRVQQSREKLINRHSLLRRPRRGWR